MLRRLGDYSLRSVMRSYNGQKFNRRRACWYAVFEVDLSRANLSNANLSVKPVEGKLVVEPVEGEPVSWQGEPIGWKGEPINYWLDHSSFLKK